MYVYILSDYDEHGAENVSATLSRTSLLDMLRSNWETANLAWREEASAKLAELLDQSDETLSERNSGHNLHRGWGGAQLHVVRLSP